MDLQSVVPSLKTVYAKPAYVILTLLNTLITMIFYVSITNLPLLTYAVQAGYPVTVTATILWGLLIGIEQASGITTASIIVLSSLLVGVNTALLTYRVRAFGFSAKQGGSSFSGFLLAAAGAGCPACATGLLSILGVAGGLAVLPFNGWELRILSFVFLLVPIYWLSRDIANNGACPI